MRSTRDMIFEDVEREGHVDRHFIADLAAKRGVDFQACIAYADELARLGRLGRPMTAREAAKLGRLANAPAIAPLVDEPEHRANLGMSPETFRRLAASVGARPSPLPRGRRASGPSRCADCGAVGERTGHQGCQYPQDR